MARTRFTVKEGISVADDNVVGGYPLIPVGALMPFAGATAPDGWLLCNGAAISRTTYANLWALVSTTYGGGDGTTTFNIPDMRSRMPIGAGSGTGLTTRAIAATGGTESVVIASGNLPTHAHTMDHGHTNTISATAGNQSVDHSHGVTIDQNNFSTGGHSVDHSHGVTIDQNNFSTGTVSSWHTHDATTGYANTDHNHVANRSAIATAGTNRLVVSTTTSDSGFTTAGGGNVHTHSLTTGNPSANHDHTANHAHTGSSGGVSANHSHTANHAHTGSSGGASVSHNHAVTVSGGVTSFAGSTTGTFTNTALGLMNPFLALNYIIKY